MKTTEDVLAVLLWIVVLAFICGWYLPAMCRMQKKEVLKRKQVHEAERQRLFDKIKEFPELSKELYQTIEDREARFRREKKKTVIQKEVVVQGQPDETQTPLQLFKAAFMSFFK
jgi:hypothetical protein